MILSTSAESTSSGSRGCCATVTRTSHVTGTMSSSFISGFSPTVTTEWTQTGHQLQVNSTHSRRQETSAPTRGVRAGRRDCLCTPGLSWEPQSVDSRSWSHRAGDRRRARTAFAREKGTRGPRLPVFRSLAANTENVHGRDHVDQQALV